MKGMKAIAFFLVVLALLAPAAAKPQFEWEKVFGSKKHDETITSIHQTLDGGYLIAGTKGNWSKDLYIAKLDENGEVQWEKTIDFDDADIPYAILQTPDGGCLISVEVRDNSLWPGLGHIIKLDPEGNVQWDKRFGEYMGDIIHSIQQTDDGGYIIAGRVSWDRYVAKLDQEGNILWERAFESKSMSSKALYSIQQTSDGGYIAAGEKEYDFYVVKFDRDGNIEWEKTYGGEYTDCARAIQQTSGGYIVAGWSMSFSNGGKDIYVMKLDKDGTLLWDMFYGKSLSDEEAHSILQTPDGGYIVLGRRIGTPSHTILMKLDKDRNILWKGILESEYGKPLVYAMEPTDDGGLILAGRVVVSYGDDSDFYIVKLSLEPKLTLTPSSKPTKTGNEPTTQTGTPTLEKTESTPGFEVLPALLGLALVLRRSR